jgi:hypothetical protein
MLITNSEIVLIVWGLVMTILWQREAYKSEEFKQFTVFKLQQVLSGKAKIVDNGESIEIINL